MAKEALALISIAYFYILFFDLATTVLISLWMADTFGANASFGRHFALLTIVGKPLAAASDVHLFPDVFLNALVTCWLASGRCAELARH